MSIELLPVGVKCVADCTYCYEKPLRDAGNFSAGYDLDKMKEGLSKEGYRFALFGGEPLLMPIDDMEEIFRWGLERYGSNGIQTSAITMTERHIQMFLKYRVSVGISMDGPDELNDSRWMGTLEKTRAGTERSLWAIRRLCEVRHTPSLIVTLYRGNASRDQLPRLVEWFESLAALGVSYVNIHLLEIDSPDVREKMALSDNDTMAALLTLFELQKRLPLKFELFQHMTRLLAGQDQLNGQGVSCVWNACDSYTTDAVRGINGIGENTNCGRTNKDGVDWGKSDTHGYERQVMLYQTPYKDGGCQDCRFFMMCKGQCPGTAVDGDWRNRSEQCQVWYRTFEHLEREMLHAGQQPLSRSPLRKAIERTMIDAWESGKNLSAQQAIAVMNGAPMPDGNQEHGDHYDCPNGYEHVDGPLELHGDNGATVMHNDSDLRAS